MNIASFSGISSKNQELESAQSRAINKRFYIDIIAYNHTLHKEKQNRDHEKKSPRKELAKPDEYNPPLSESRPRNQHRFARLSCPEVDPSPD
ncbi:hypothetical protein EST62_00460 [Chlorobaculum sp. 24CR]|uniref:hypothetical protein n=1 Tax=Chlorobaculum sp. 24CR TaxID=2508878 RepID=UPI00100B4303|nr:hypothetical protein [Chlorobaculum sp. 24CR]RXK89048.1 hypothetical protein EST62_00460 [Chlorobaculum sp. 24CR]